MPGDDQKDAPSNRPGIALSEADRATHLIARENAERDIRTGALWFFGGLLVTAISYSMAGPGDSYLLAWGAILFGGYQLVRGLAASSGLDGDAPGPEVRVTGEPEGDGPEASAISTPQMPPTTEAAPTTRETWGIPAWVTWTLIVGASLLVLLVLYQIDQGNMPF